MKKYFLLVLLGLLLLPAVSSGLIVPERLDYDLTLADINVGSMSLEAAPKGQHVLLESKSSSAKWVSLFYDVDDHAVSLLGKSQLKELPKTFAFVPVSSKVSINEGPNRAQKEFAFDYGKKVISYSDTLKREKANLALKGLTLDALSALYYMRHVPLKPGTSFAMNIFNNKVTYRTEVQVLRKEAVDTALGRVNTFVLRANMDGVGDGVIYYPGDIYIWLTDDDKRVPVIIEKRLRPLIEGKIPDVIKKNMPDFLLNKISSGAVRAVIVKK